MSNFDDLCKKILGLSDEHKVNEVDINTLKSFARIALDTVNFEASHDYKHFTSAGINICKKFDARNCKTNLGVMGAINEFEIFNKSGLVLATDNGGWKFELTALGATIVRLALEVTKQAKSDNKDKDMECECGAVEGQDCNWVASSNGDDCTCNNCGWQGVVVQGCEICPSCKSQGNMTWTNEEELED